MARSLGGDFFPWAIGLSLMGHLMLPWIPTGDIVDLPDYEIEERVAAEPMTVRLIVPEPEQAPVEAPPISDPVLTSEQGSYVVEDIQPLPTEIERRPQEPAPPEHQAPLPVAEEDPEPLPIVPETVPKEVAPEPPPPEELPEAEPQQSPPKEVELPPGPVEQETQSGVVSRAEPLSKGNRAPRYPRRARASKMQGTTELEVVVRSDGTVERLSVKSSSGHSLLDDEALKAVKRWRFTPAASGSGARMSDTVIVPVTFRLQGR